MVRTLLQPRFVGMALGIALMLGCFPAGAQARMVRSMASGAQELTPRQAKQAEIQRLLGEQKVADTLKSLGLTADQVRSRLDQLTDPQLEQLAQHLETIQAGKGTLVALCIAAVLLLAALLYMQIEAA